MNLEAARRAALTMPEHLQKLLPDVVAGDPTATLVFLAVGLKAKETGKKRPREKSPIPAPGD